MILNQLERDHLIMLEDNGQELSDEAKLMLAQAEEADLDRLIDFMDDDDELN